MLESLRIIKRYGIEPSKADEILNVDVFTKLEELSNRTNQGDLFKASVMDESVTEYLKTSEVEKILSDNSSAPEAIEVGEIGGIDIGGNIDLGSLENLPDFDIRVLDTTNLPDLPDIGELPEIPELGGLTDERTPPPVIDTEKPKTGDETFGLIFQDVEISQFFITYSGNKVPMTDSEGQLVVNHGDSVFKARYYEDFARMKTMPVSGEMVELSIFSKDKKMLEGLQMGQKIGEMAEVDYDFNESLEDTSLLFDTQQYLKDNTSITLSFNAVSTMLKQMEEDAFVNMPKLSLPHGVAIQSDASLASLFYLQPKVMYDLANCEEFYQVTILENNYMTNYCEANDLEHLRIFEIGGNHLDVPIENQPDGSIMSHLMQDIAFQGRVASIIEPNVVDPIALQLVGIAPSTPKEIAFNKIDNLSERAGYMVYVNPETADIVYIPTVIINYFEKFYEGVEPFIGAREGSGKYRVISFQREGNIEGFYLLDKDKVKVGTPSKVLPSMADKTVKMLRSNHLADFTNKIDLIEYVAEEIMFLGEEQAQAPRPERIEPTPEKEADSDNMEEAIKDLERQKEEFQQAIALMDAEDDEDLIEELKMHIQIIDETLRELGETPVDTEGEKEIVEAMEEVPEADELVDMAERNDQTALPVPMADEPILEEAIELGDIAENLDLDIDINLSEEQVEEVEDEEDAEEEDDVEDVFISEMPEIPEGTEIYGDPEVGEDEDEDEDEDDDEEEDALFRGVNKEKIENFIDDMAESNWDEFQKLKDEMDESPESSEEDAEVLSPDSIEEEIEDNKEEDEAETKFDLVVRKLSDANVSVKALLLEDGRIQLHLGFNYSDEKADKVFDAIEGIDGVEVMAESNAKAKKMRRTPILAKGGKTKPKDIQAIVDAMTDKDVAKKIVEVLFNDLGYGDYDASEEEAYEYALKNIDESRDFLLKMMRTENFAKGGKTKGLSWKKVMNALTKSSGGPYTILRWHPTLNELEHQWTVNYPQETLLKLSMLIKELPEHKIYEIEDNSGQIVFRHTHKE